ncbi:malate:quinone oxidoreductase [Neisseria gonorrhoeae]|nr:malate:quinone oxidoreductase [Neisseria gonorrhoeae]
MLMPPEAQVFITAGRRVQIIKQAPEKGGIPKSGTEIAARIGGIP